MLFFSGFSLYGAMLLLPLYYQEVRGASALTAGIMLVPQGVGALLSRGLAGRLTDKIGGRPIAVAGFVIVTAATVPFAFAGAHTNPWLLALCLVIRGFGLGAVTIPVMAVAFLGLDKEQIPHASVVTRTVQQIGGSFGTAVLAVILSAAVTARHGDLAAGFDIAFMVGRRLLRTRRPAVALAPWRPAHRGHRTKRRGRTGRPSGPVRPGRGPCQRAGVTGHRTDAEELRAAVRRDLAGPGRVPHPARLVTFAQAGTDTGPLP